MACIFLYYEVDCIIVCVLPVWNLKKLRLHECRLARVKDIPGAIASRVILALAKSSCALTRSVTKILDGALVCISRCAGVNVVKLCLHVFPHFHTLCPAFSFTDVDTYEFVTCCQWPISDTGFIFNDLQIR